MLTVIVGVVEPPVFITVKVWLDESVLTRVAANVFEVGLMDSAPAVAPVPLRATAARVPPGLALRLRLPLCAVAVVGVKATTTVHMPSAGMAAMQLLVITEKPVPVTPTVGMPVETSPVLDSVKVEVLVVLTVTLPKSFDSGFTPSSAGSWPRPVKFDESVPPVVAVAENVAVLLPALVGVKRSVTMQVLPLMPMAARVWPLQASMPLTMTN